MSSNEAKTQWAPGPWEVVNGTDVFTTNGATNAQGVFADHNDGWQIADCCVGLTSVDGVFVSLTTGEEQANARLIAAAPELYEALAFMVANIGEPDSLDTHDGFNKARALLSRIQSPSATK